MSIKIWPLAIFDSSTNSYIPSGSIRKESEDSELIPSLGAVGSHTVQGDPLKGFTLVPRPRAPAGVFT